jgi:sortase A
MPIGKTHRRRVELALIVVGVICLGWSSQTYWRPALYRAAHREELDRLPPATDPVAPAPLIAEPAEPSLPIGALVGVLEIPRLKFSQEVAEGDDDGTLKAAIGHLPDTPLPWASGNGAYAGHRDAHFRPLAGVRVGDDIQLRTPRGLFRYRIDNTLIVTPEDVWVLRPTRETILTLITCYPFDFIGRAPKRFIVRAHAVE